MNITEKKEQVMSTNAETEQKVEEVIYRVAAVFNFGIAKKEWLKQSRMARLIASLPFIAGCEKPRETAISHLTVYILSLEDDTKDVFYHTSADDTDIFTRFKPISNFKGGNRSVIEHGMNLIALCIISNYRKSRERDKARGKYNPGNEAGWDLDSMQKDLIEKIEANPVKEIDEIYSMETATQKDWID